MASLLDHIDRFSRNARLMHKTAASTEASSGPFTRAVLDAYLGDLARDIDPTELGLFALVKPDPQRQLRHLQPEQDRESAVIQRASFHGATPLRKRPATTQRNPKEHEPEVYLKAALACIDRYQTVTPMDASRGQVEALIDQLAKLRVSLDSLSDGIVEVENKQAPSLKSDADREEKRIKELQFTLSQVEKRKAQILRRRKEKEVQKPETPPPPPIPSEQPQDQVYFGTPGPNPHTLHFSAGHESLLNEDAGNALGDVSTASFVFDPLDSTPSSLIGSEHEPELEGSPSPVTNTTPATVDQEVDIEEPTVTLEAPPEKAETSSLPPPKPKMKINHEVERIVAKIWVTMGNVIEPGQKYDIHGSRPEHPKPPLAKETLTILENLASMPIVPASEKSLVPSSASSSAATQIEDKNILTGHLLLSLLKTTGGKFSLSLSAAKDVLGQKISADTGTGRAPAVAQGTRIIYSCVAKRLLKIERGGGEQVVKFDV